MTKRTLPKWFLASRGVLGSLLAIAAIGLAAYGVEFSPESQTLLLDQLDAVVLASMALVGSVVGIYGRLKAKRALTILPKPAPKVPERRP